MAGSIMQVVDRFRSAITGMSQGWRFSGRGGSYGMWPALLPSTNIDYVQAAGDPLQNTVVLASIQWIMRAFPEAPFRVLQATPAGDEMVANHRLTRLLRTPNPFYSGTILLQATTASLNLAGNAYWVKMKGLDTGITERLYYVPHHQIFPRWDESGTEYITHYEYRVDNQRIAIPVENIVHFRNGLDPNNTRSGLSPLAAALRDIYTDNEAANWTASILRNAAVPGIIISPSHPEGSIDDPQHVKDLFIAKFTGDKRAEPLVLDGGIKVDVIQFSPQEMNIRDLRRLPEERISACLGVPAMVVGLGAGLERSTFTNMTEARLMAYESNIVPTYRLIADELDHNLLQELGYPDRGERSDFDISKVRVLQDDQNALFQRNTIAFEGNWMKRSEARAQANLPVGPDDDIYFSEVVPAPLQLQADTAVQTAKMGAAQLGPGKAQGGDRPAAGDGLKKKTPTPAGR